MEDAEKLPRKQRRLQWWRETLKNKKSGKASRENDTGTGGHRRRKLDPIKRTMVSKVTSCRSVLGRTPKKGALQASPPSTQCEDEGGDGGGDDPLAVKQTKKKKKQTLNRRYILFVGNLSFSATAEDVKEHFRRRGVPVIDVRMLTEKESGKSRGCCFVEFANDKSQQNALKFQRTKLHDRSIKIEVTCGGGGGGQRRREKLDEKNTKLVRSQRRKEKRKKRTRTRKTREETSNEPTSGND